jgi:hypothetical protein
VLEEELEVDAPVPLWSSPHAVSAVMARISEEIDATRPTRPVIVNTFPSAASADASPRATTQFESRRPSFRTDARSDQGLR